MHIDVSTRTQDDDCPRILVDDPIDQIILRIRQFKGPINPLSVISVIEPHAYHGRIIATNRLRNRERGPPKLRNRAATATVLILDPEPITAPLLKVPRRDIGMRRVISPVVDDELVVKIDADPGVRSRAENMQRRRVAPNYTGPTHRELERQSVVRRF